jgi:hypothetical protein
VSSSIRSIAAILFPAAALLVPPSASAAPLNYLFLGGDDPASFQTLLGRPDIAGAQVVIAWRKLEPREGRYDFSSIEADLAVTRELKKQLFVQIQDRFFDPRDRGVPDYLLHDPIYGGGLAEQVDFAGEGKPVGSGWVARQWDPHVRARFQALLKALATRFDGQLAGINLPETAADLTPAERRKGFSCDAYFNGELENLAAARAAFKRTQVVQYINFWPCEWNNDHGFMERTFAFALAHGIGLGGPDVVPNRKGQMKNSYPFFHRYKGKLPLVAMAVQEPTLTYTNPETGKRFTKAEIVEFADGYLGADIIFWTPAAPWLNEKRVGRK